MCIILTIRESSHGLWRICSGSELLFDRLHFAAAIRLARGLAREHHARADGAVCVMLTSAEFNIVLAEHSDPVAPLAVAGQNARGASSGAACASRSPVAAEDHLAPRRVPAGNVLSAP